MEFSECSECGNKKEKCRNCFRHICMKKGCFYYNSDEFIKIDKPHTFCLECGKVVVCHFKGICSKCDIPLHMITEGIGVGSREAKYDTFDIIINLNFPENSVRVHEIKEESKGGKLILKIGIFDTVKEKIYMESLVSFLLPKLVDYCRKNKEKKILFHCFSGYSRSISLATAFIAMMYNKTTWEALLMIKEKRKYVKPKDEFIKVIENFLEKK